MNYRVLIGTMLFAGLSSTATLAQDTLGELIDAGGKRLSKNELTPIIGGNNMSGPSKSGGQFQADYKDDGSMSGSLAGPQGNSFPLWGSWMLDDSDRLCSSFSAGGRRNTDCVFVYKSNEQYYVSNSDSDKSSPVLKRTLKPIKR